MHESSAHCRIAQHQKAVACILLSLASVAAALGAENGGSVYPAGVETAMPGMLPPGGRTIFLEFDEFYRANGLMDGKGHSSVPGFHLSVAAEAVKIVHNWGVHALGGTLVSAIGLPVVSEFLSGPFGKLNKTGLTNPDIGVLAVSYHTHAWHYWYGMDVFTPGAQYNKNDIVNIGQHNYAVSPQGAFTYLPRGGKSEISSKVQYIVNFTNPANQYRSGHELVWEYDAMQNIGKKLSVGLNGYFYFQTNDDLQNGIRVGSGNRGRSLTPGPQLNYHVGKGLLVLKYQKDVMVENRARGNSFWFALGVPLWHVED